MLTVFLSGGADRRCYYEKEIHRWKGEEKHMGLWGHEIIANKEITSGRCVCYADGDVRDLTAEAWSCGRVLLVLGFFVTSTPCTLLRYDVWDKDQDTNKSRKHHAGQEVLVLP